MFCAKCGSQVPDGATFCAKCGNPMGQAAPAQQPVQPAQPAQQPVQQPVQQYAQPTQPVQQYAQPVQPYAQQPMQYAPAAPSAGALAAQKMFGNFLKNAGDVFTGKGERALDRAAKSDGLEWIISLGLAFLFFSLSFAFTAPQFVLGLFRIMGMGNTGIGQFYRSFANYAGCWGTNMLVACFSMGVTFAALFLLVKVIYKKNVSLFQVLNVWGVAALPLCVAYILNMFIGFIWWPFALITLLVAATMSGLLLCMGIRKLCGEDRKPLYGMVGLSAAVIILSLLFGIAMYAALVF